MENPTYQKMSEDDFVQLLTENANMLKNHLKDTQCSLIMCANIRLNTTIFRLYITLEKDSLKFQYTITNLGNLGEQLYQLWLQYCCNHVFHRISYFFFTYFLVGNVRRYHWISTHIFNIFFLHVIVNQC